MPIKATVLLSRPSFLIAPRLKISFRALRQKHALRGFEVGAGMVERGR